MVARTMTTDYEYQIAVSLHTHAALVRSVLGINIVGDSTIKQECEPRLRIAKELLDRIEELSCGQWKISHQRVNRTPVKFMYLEVSLKEEFLRKVGVIPSKRNTFEVVEVKVPGETVIKVRLGCTECRKAFSVYASSVMHDQNIREQRPLLFMKP